MPRHYQDNDRPLKEHTGEMYFNPILFDVRIMGRFIPITYMIDMIKPIIRYHLVTTVYGHQFLNNNDEMSVAKAVLDNRKQSPTAIVSHKLQRIIQGHIIWYWD